MADEADTLEAPSTGSPAGPPEQAKDSPAPREDKPTPSISDIVDARAQSVGKGLGDILSAKMASDERTTDAMERQMASDQAMVARQFNATRESAEKLKPWNYEEQTRKFYTDPLQAFGSVGSVFGIIASAFTHAPMTNALNASAAAINAIKKNDEAEYQRAHESWKENMQLMEKRHQMEREAFQDASTIMKNNWVNGEAKLRTNAIRFGDQKALFLLDNGMSDELFKVMESRDRAVNQAMDTFNKTQEFGLDQALVQHLTPTKEQEPDPTKRMVAELQARQMVRTMKNEKDARWGQYIDWWLDYLKANNKEDPPWPEKQKKMDELGLTHKYGAGRGGDTQLTTERQKAAYRAKRTAELIEEGNDEQDAIRQANQEANNLFQKGVSPNRADQLIGLAQKADRSVEIIDKIEKILQKNGFITGLGGQFRRRAEVFADWLGSNRPEAREFERYIQELRLQTPRLTTESFGRPLTAEEEKVNKIVPGLEFGSTKAYTSRELLDLKAQLQEMAGQWRARAGETKAAPSARKTSTQQWYDSVPDKVVGGQ